MLLLRNWSSRKCVVQISVCNVQFVCRKVRKKTNDAVQNHAGKYLFCSHLIGLGIQYNTIQHNFIVSV